LIEFTATPSLLDEYPDAIIGVLALTDVINPSSDPGLEQMRSQLQDELRGEYGELNRPQIKELPRVQPYVQYYKRFKKTYHVQLQLESIVTKGKPIPAGPGLVQAMFLAELKNHLLTAGHDRDKVLPPLSVQVAEGFESYTAFSGTEQTLKAGDLYISDQRGILSNIVYGPAGYASIRPDTTSVVYTTYGVPGISRLDMDAHLNSILENVRAFAPHAEIETRSIFGSI
jgi:DNA/RNA-binding domain of Phe-tRNA-synthetase-like protein